MSWQAQVGSEPTWIHRNMPLPFWSWPQFWIPYIHTPKMSPLFPQGPLWLQLTVIGISIGTLNLWSKWGTNCRLSQGIITSWEPVQIENLQKSTEITRNASKSTRNHQNSLKNPRKGIKTTEISSFWPENVPKRPWNYQKWPLIQGSEKVKFLISSLPSLCHPGVDPELESRILSPSYLGGDEVNYEEAWRDVSSLNPKAELWIGESGGAYNSGSHLLTNAFISGFWSLPTSQT